MKFRSWKKYRESHVLNIIVLLYGLLGSVSSQADTYAQLKSFGYPTNSGAGPLATLIEGSDGVLYGTTPDSGTEGAGTVFKFNKDGSGYAVLHHFTPSTADGENPWAAVVEASDGKLYGTAQFGGTSANGTVFRLNKDGSGYTNLHSFTDATNDGAQPISRLIEATDGKLYGTAQFGGTSNYGSIFRMNKDGSGYTNLYSFTGALGDGVQPVAGLVQGGDGRLYGTTFLGGALTNAGMVFRLNTNGTSYTNLHSFTYTGSDGAYPIAGLLKATNGVLYGTTSLGGSSDAGTMFKMTTNGVFTPLSSFTGTSGGNPSAALIEGSNSVLYGTTQYGGTMDSGTVFKVTTNGTGYAVLHNFTYTTNDGAYPYAGLVKGTNGVLYGVTPSGGSADGGTAFKLNQDGTSYAILRVFNLSGGDGWDPETRLVEGSGSVLYGVTQQGGTNASGTVFKLNKDGSGYTLLRQFIGGTNDGQLASGLLRASDGILYGVTAQGGSFFGGSAGGTLFSITTNGTGYTVLHNFGAAGDGAFPNAAPIEASDGLLYGTTTYGGTNDAGAIYKLNKNGTGYTNLYRFKISGGDGHWPFAPLVEGGDLALYGTTKVGGSNGSAGIVFKLNKNGSGYTNLHSFTNLSSDGKNPVSGLLKGSDGALYGTTLSGGTNDNGTIYKLNTNGSGYTVLYRFNPDAGEGRNPCGGLIESTNGALYGTTQNGGTDDAGTVFTLNKDGTCFSVVRSFSSSGGDGMNPKATLVVGSDAALYGATADGGVMNLGSLFKITLTGPPVISSQPLSSASLNQDDVTLTTSVTGTGPFTYQWYFNGSAISGANDPDLTLSNLTPGQAGRYWVVVCNSAGAVTSAVSTVSYFRLDVSNGLPSLVVAGPTGLVYGIDYRNELANNWQSLTNFTLTTSPKTVADPAGSSQGHRFYRALFFP